MNKKGFTLMEILAVLLILALVTMFALPAIRQVRSVVQYHQAKAAAVKMAAAIRTYYQNTKGYYVTGIIYGKSSEGNGTNSAQSAGETGCSNVAITGIPAIPGGGTTTSSVSQLFACDYLSVKDFKGLPYKFEAAIPSPDTEVLVTGTGTDSAGRYKNKSFTVHVDGSVKDVKGVD